MAAVSCRSGRVGAVPPRRDAGGTRRTPPSTGRGGRRVRRARRPLRLRRAGCRGRAAERSAVLVPCSGMCTATQRGRRWARPDGTGSGRWPQRARPRSGRDDRSTRTVGPTARSSGPSGSPRWPRGCAPRRGQWAAVSSPPCSPRPAGGSRATRAVPGGAHLSRSAPSRRSGRAGGRVWPERLTSRTVSPRRRSASRVARPIAPVPKITCRAVVMASPRSVWVPDPRRRLPGGAGVGAAAARTGRRRSLLRLPRTR